MPKIINILLIDDHPMVRYGISTLLKSHIQNVQIILASSLFEAMECEQHRFNIVLLDIHLSGPNGPSMPDGIESLQPIKHKWPLAKVLMLSAQDDLATINRALAKGATGFISKAATAEMIVAKIKQVLSGDFIVPCSEASLPRRGLRAPMTPRQLEVLTLLSKGLSNKHIAYHLSLSNNTVRRHVQDILQCLPAVSRSDAVYKARLRGMIP